TPLMMRRRAVATLAILAAVMLAACGDPPDKEIQQAQTAIEAARTAGAAEYAPDEFKAAEDALKRANDPVAQRANPLALNPALAPRERAQTAAKEAGTRKAASKGEAERALGRANVASAAAHARLKAAETAHAPARALADARRTLTRAEES